MKLRIRLYSYKDFMGGTCFDGTIELNPRLLSSPIVLVSVLLHELVHWTLDAIRVYGKIHRWWDLLYTYVGLFDYEVDRASLRYWIRSDQWRGGGG